MIRFRMLGTLDLRNSDGRELRAVLRRPKLLALLSYLAIHRPLGFHRRDTLVALLWPELDHAHARNALRQAVHALREALGRDVVVARGDEELGVSAEQLWCDVRDFDAAIEAAEAEKALALFRGPLLSGLYVADVPEFERWLDQERSYLGRRACEAARLLTDQEDAAQNPSGAARWAHRLTELSPFDETAVRRLIELLNRAGDRAGALRAYDEFKRRLGRDLEVEPSVKTRGLVDAVRSRQQPEEPAAVHSNGADGVPSRAVPDAVRAGPSAAAPPAVFAARKRMAAVIGLLLGGLLTAGWLLFRTQSGARSAEVAPTPKRLVVLPFANLGAPEDRYFADGVAEEITARLAAVDRLRIIGSTSANAYRDTKKGIPEIGRELGVEYVLEGSIRWQKPAQGSARVRVTPQLVSTVDGTHLWAQVYDEPLDEIFRVQSDIAQKVVRALDIALLEQQRRAVEAIPTHNIQAYDAYLRGIEYWRRGLEERFQRSALQMFETAVELDSSFALAWAMVARLHTRIYAQYFDRSPDRLAQAKRAVDQALRLQPDLPEAHLSLGHYYWVAHEDLDRALQEFAFVAVSRPGEPGLALRAVVLSRQGRYSEALANFARALENDPRSAGIHLNYAEVFDLTRDYARAEPLYDRAIALAPDVTYPYFLKAGLRLRRDGNAQAARAVLDDAERVGLADAPYVVLAEVQIAMFERRYDAALARLSLGAPNVFADQLRFTPRAQLQAEVYGLLQQRDLERAYYDSALKIVAARLRGRPDDARLHSALGVAYAGLGRKEEAIVEGERGVDLRPISNDRYQGYYRVWDLARIYVMVGEFDKAVDRLEYLLSIPGYLSSAWLRIDPTWDPLRGHPRFQKLVAREK